jgi:hypothetical protein
MRPSAPPASICPVAASSGPLPRPTLVCPIRRPQKTTPRAIIRPSLDTLLKDIFLYMSPVSTSRSHKLHFSGNRFCKKECSTKEIGRESGSRETHPALGARYCAVMPPSSVSMVPVANRLSSLARNRIPAAISSGAPSRPSSWRAASALRVAAGSGLCLRISSK